MQRVINSRLEYQSWISLYSMMYHLFPDVCFLFFFHFTSPRSPKCRRMSTLTFLPSTFWLHERESVRINISLSSFSVSLQVHLLRKSLPRTVLWVLSPLYFPLDQATAIGVSPATSSYNGSRYYKHYNVYNIYMEFWSLLIFPGFIS